MNKNTYNIIRVRKRLKKYKDNGTNMVNKFWSKIRSTIHLTANEQYGIDLHDCVIDTLLLYSYHKQIVDEWYDIVDDFGPFAYFMKPGDLDCVENILKFENKMMQKHNIQTLPPKIRLSLMICKEMINPSYFSDYHSGGHELQINELHFNLSKFALLNNETKIQDIFGQSKQNLQQLMEFWKGMENKTDAEKVDYLIVLASFDQYDDYGIIWNVFNNKVCQKMPPEPTDWQSMLNEQHFCDYGIHDLDELSIEVLYASSFRYSDFVQDEINEYINNEIEEDEEFLRGSYTENVNTIKTRIVTQIGDIEWDDDQHSSEDVRCEDILLDGFLDIVYETQYKPLIYGYLRQQSIAFNIRVPEHLIKLLLTYYPFFCGF